MPFTLPIGSSAPDFNLKGVDGKQYSISSFKDAKLLVVLFYATTALTLLAAKIA